MQLNNRSLDRTFGLGHAGHISTALRATLKDEDGEVLPGKQGMTARYDKNWDMKRSVLRYNVLDRELDSAVGKNFDQFRSSLLARFENKKLRDTVRDWLSREVPAEGTAQAKGSRYQVNADRVLVRQEYQAPVRKPKPVTRIPLGGTKALMQLDGIWYEAEEEPVDPTLTWYPEVVSKRQLSSKELRTHNLANL